MFAVSLRHKPTLRLHLEDGPNKLTPHSDNRWTVNVRRRPVPQLPPGRVNVGLGDGSVRFIKNSIANYVWYELLVSIDGGIISSDQY
jgi:prepilin-type processing-associated H-X9-DG protein